MKWTGYPSFSSQQNCTRTKRGEVSYIPLAEIVRQVARVTQKFFDVRTFHRRRTLSFVLTNALHTSRIAVWSQPTETGALDLGSYWRATSSFLGSTSFPEEAFSPSISSASAIPYPYKFNSPVSRFGIAPALIPNMRKQKPIFALRFQIGLLIFLPYCRRILTYIIFNG